MTKQSIQEDEIDIDKDIDISVSNIGAPRYRKQILTDKKEKLTAIQ